VRLAKDSGDVAGERANTHLPTIDVEADRLIERREGGRRERQRGDDDGEQREGAGRTTHDSPKLADRLFPRASTLGGCFLRRQVSHTYGGAQWGHWD